MIKNCVIFRLNDEEETFRSISIERMRLSLLLLTCFQIDRLKSRINDTTHWVIERKNSFILDAYQSHWWCCAWHNKKKRHLQRRVINHGRWCKSLVRTSVINWRNDFVKCNNCCGLLWFPFRRIDVRMAWKYSFVCCSWCAYGKWMYPSHCGTLFIHSLVLVVLVTK